MSIFASQVTATHEFKCAPGQFFTVRKLTWLELNEAQKARAESVVEWAYKMMSAGLVSWSFPEPLSRDVFDSMVDEAVDQVTTEALRLTKPSAFETPAEAEAAQKND